MPELIIKRYELLDPNISWENQVCICPPKFFNFSWGTYGPVWQWTWHDDIELPICDWCHKPKDYFVDECWGCFEKFWGRFNTDGKKGCRECQPWM